MNRETSKGAHIAMAKRGVYAGRVRKFATPHWFRPFRRSRSAAVVRPAIAGLLMLAIAPAAVAQSPRAGSAAWYAAFAAQRGASAPGSSAGPASGNATNVAPNSPTGVSAGISRSVANFAQAARALAQAQAAQSAARTAGAPKAAAAVPDGLTPGGLWAGPTALKAWSGAAPPTAASSAGPTGAAGHAGGTIVTVNQTAPTADLTWTNFNVGANTTLNFNQPGTSSVVLNRVSDPNAAPSQIFGAINAPGLVLVLNPNGILFGGGSQVNVGGMVASTANLAAAQFSNIAAATASTVFTGATAPVTVQAGASITATVPMNAAYTGGYVLLLGQTVRNDGQITTPNGQTVLAAGPNFTIRDGYGPNNTTSTTLGLEVSACAIMGTTCVTGPGTVTNTGLIQASVGDITLTGETVLQAGVLLSSTTVAQRGTIHLLTDTTDATAAVTFAPGSLTAILPLNDGTTETDSQRAAKMLAPATNGGLPALNNQFALPDQQYQSRIEIVSGGSVEFQNGSLNLSTGGQIALHTAGRVLVDSGAALSAAGSIDTILPATANTITEQVTPYDMRDAPANRDTGNLTTQPINLSAGDLVSIGPQGNLYTPGGLFEVSGYVNQQGHTIGEWTSVGGSITLNAAEVVAQQGATFNISGGLVAYAAGNTPNSWLVAANGQLYNANNAPANVTYTGVYGGFVVSQPRWGITETFNSPLIAPATTFTPGYTVGRDAGTLTIDAPTTVMEATIAAGISNGAFQNAARPASVPDPFLLAQTVVPLPGILVLGPFVLAGGTPVVQTTDIRITPDGQPLASSLDLVTPIPADRVGTTWIAASLLNDAALGGLTLATLGAIDIEAPVTLADGGGVSLLAPTVIVAASVTARGGPVTAGNFPTVYSGTNFLDAKNTSGAFLPSSFTLGAGATIDTRGVFSNLAVNPTTAAGEAFVNGGAVTIDTSGAVTLAAGSAIDASAGGAVLANHAAKGGAGGALSITAYDPNDANAAVYAGPVTIAAALRSLGSGGVPCTACTGGGLTLTVPSVLIGGAATDPSTVALTVDFFASGFSSYTISGQNGVTVAPGTQVAVVQPIEQFTAATALFPGGTDPALAFTTGLPALYTANLATATLTQRHGASIALKAGTFAVGTGNLTIGAGAAITVDPSQTIALEAGYRLAKGGPGGQITIDGTLTAPSGTISVINDSYQSTTNSLSIWLGGDSVLDVSARAVTALDALGQVFGTVPNGGTIRIGGQSVDANGGQSVDTNSEFQSTNAFIVVQPGAVLNAAGSSALLDPAAGQDLGGGRSVSGGAVLVASNGGTISFDSQNGILLGGKMTAPAGGPGAQGGTLSVNLVTPDYADTSRFLNGGLVPDVPAFDTPRELVIGGGTTSFTAPPSPGVGFADSAFGQTRLTTGQIAAGGFDVLNLAGGDAILFDGSVALSAGRSITLNTAILADTATNGAVSVNAPYVTLAGNGTVEASGATFVRGGDTPGTGSPHWQPSAQSVQTTLRVNAANIDVSGNLYIGVNAPIIATPVGTATPCPRATCTVVDLAGFASTTLFSSGDIRFLPSSSTGNFTTLTTPGDLTLVAGQVYPVAGANAIVTAGLAYDPANTVASYSDTLSYDGTLTIAAAPGPVPAPPLTAGGMLTLRAGTIEQGGVLRAPDGQITLGAVGSNGQYAPNLNQSAASSRVVFAPGSITSVSMNGLTIPYGGTSDGTVYTVVLNGAAAPALAPQLSVNAETIQVQAGATLDVSGGGVLAGAGFVPGRGGSTDILQSPLLTLTASGTVTLPAPATNLVFAIVPGFGDSVAPPTATATAFTGPRPSAGDQITLGAGVPGLPAGTYTLLPGSDALLPGAYRVQLATTLHTVLPGAANLGNGSYLVNGYRGVANTGVVAALPIQVTVTPGAAVRLETQYDETSYSAYELSQAALFGQARASLTLPADAKTLALGFPATPASPELAFQNAGTLSSAPGAGGLGGIVELNAAASIEVIASGATPTSGMVSILGSDLSSLKANTLIVGGTLSTSGITAGKFASSAQAVIVRTGAGLSAAQVFLVSSGGITVEGGATISTIGAGAPSLDSSSGLVFSNNGNAVLAISNGTLTFVPATLSSGGSIAIGSCPATCAGPATLLSQGAIQTVTTGAVTLDPTTQLGTAALSLSASLINFGTPPAGIGGLTLTEATLQGLLAGNAAEGVPGLRQLTLTATNSVNFNGTFTFDTTNAAGQSSLQSLQLNTPAIFGAAGATASLTTGTFIWNGLLTADGLAAAAPGIWSGGPGGGTLSISASTIVLGYGASDQAQNAVSLSRLILGFSSVSLTASQSIAGNNQGSLTVYQTGTQDATGALLTGSGGALTLNTPLLTGAPGSVLTITAGGTLSIAANASAPTSAAVAGQGASLTLNASAISANTAIVLPSGQLAMNAQGAIDLGAASRLDLAGVTTTLFDQTTYGWGGAVTLQSAAGGITQSAGGTIDVSAGNANAGSVTVIAQGVASFGGSVNAAAAAGYTSGSFSVRASGFGAADPTSGFNALNATLNSGGVFGARSFELLSGDLLTIGNDPATGAPLVNAHTVSVSVDNGGLTVNGTINASGAAPGTISLAAHGDLSLAAGAVLDAHGTQAQVDGYGQSIDSENTASVTLTSAAGTLRLDPAAIINVSAPVGCAFGLACGQVTLNAPRTGETSGGVAISAPGTVNIQGAGSIVANAFWTYAPTDPAGTIVQDNALAGVPAGAVGLTQIDTASQAFMALAGNATPAGLASYGSVFHLRPGVEIDSGAASGGNLTVASDADLSVYRYSDPAGYGLQVDPAVYGSGEPGALVIRAADSLTITGSINDGFTGAWTLYTDAASTMTHTYWELAQPLQPTATDPVLLSWSIRLVGGSDLKAADSRIVLPPSQLVATAADPAPGSIVLNDPHPQPYGTAGDLPGWSVIRTGTGGLDLVAGGPIDELSTYAIYTAGAISATGTAAQPAADSADNLPRGTVTTPLQVVFSVSFGTKIPAGTILTGGGATFTTTNTRAVSAFGSSVTLTVTATSTPAGGFNIGLGTPLTLATSIPGVKSAVTADVFDSNGVTLPGTATTVSATFSVPSGTASTTLPAGTLLTDGIAANPTEFRTLNAITLSGGSPAAAILIVPVNQSSTFDDPRGTALSLVSPIGGVTVAISLAPTSVPFNSLVSNYQAYYPQGGGNLLISAGGNITGYLATPSTGSTSPPMDGVGDWLSRQGGGASGASTAWWINYGTLVLPLGQSGVDTQSTPVPGLTGFIGFGTLGGGNATILAGGTIGATAASFSSSNAAYTVTGAIDVAVASTGRVAQGATGASGITQTGGGMLTIQAGGGFNPGGTSSPGGTGIGSNQADGTLTDTRGAINVIVGSIGQIVLSYGAVNAGDPRAPSPLTAYQATAQGGPTVVPGDASVSLEARGDLVLGGVGDPTRLTEQNLTPANLTSGAPTGLSWFSLWQPTTAITLTSAGGNLVVSTQAVVAESAESAEAQQQNALATDNRFLYPPSLTAVAASGSIYAGTFALATVTTPPPSSIELAPSPTGQLALLAAGSIYGDSSSLGNGQPQSFDVSGASAAALPSPLQPAFMTAGGGASNLAPNIGAQALSLFAFGADTASGTLHAGDPTSALIYAGADIVDMRYGQTLTFTAVPPITPATWYVSGKAVRVIAGGDIVEPGTVLGQTDPLTSGNYTSTSGLIVNNNSGDVSVIQAGGEIIYANATVAGPGQLYVQAGGTVYQGSLGVLQSLGPLSNGAITVSSSRTGGAGITVLAGAGTSGPDWTAFAQTYLAPNMGYGATLLTYLQGLGYMGDQASAPTYFEALQIAQQRALLLRIYFAELATSDNDFNGNTGVHFKSYIRGKTAIATLFPAGSIGTGDITMFGVSGVSTDFGGAITLLTPGGATTLGNTTPPAASTSPPGVLSQGGTKAADGTTVDSDVDIYSLGSVILGQSRVFTTFGGNIVIWSAGGDINAGIGTKTTQLVSAALVDYDKFGRVTLTPGIPTSGAGIATLAPIPGTPTAFIDLVAPVGVIDAGEAGIRVSGNLNIAALAIVNAANVQVGGKSTGLPTIAAPNVSALSAASGTAAAAAQSAQGAANAAGAQSAQQVPSTITVELIGFGEP
jgi:filamentous hemagglutinin family protein